MIRVVHRAPRLLGSVRPPGDKSLAHRALLLGAAAAHRLTVRGLPAAEDVASTRRCLADLGVEFVDLEPGAVRVHPPATWHRGRWLDCGNSGTTARLLAGLLAGLRVPAVLDGDASLRRRPMQRVAAPLAQLGAHVTTHPDGTLPLHIRYTERRLRGGHVVLPVASAQLKSAVLFAGLNAEGPVAVTEPAASRDHTERLLGALGADIVRDGLTVTIGPCAERLRARELELPGDISTAAFFLAAGATVPESAIHLKDVGVNPTRAGILEVMRRMGAHITLSNQREMFGEPIADLTVESADLTGTVVAGELVPRMIDELPVLAVLATRAHGTTVVRQAAELRYKESDRIATTVSELAKLGADIEELDDGFEVRGPTALVGAPVAAGGDHRLAMALAIAGLVAEGKTRIAGAEVADVSHPAFWDDLRLLRGENSPQSEVVA